MKQMLQVHFNNRTFQKGVNFVINIVILLLYEVPFNFFSRVYLCLVIRECKYIFCPSAASI